MILGDLIDAGVAEIRTGPFGTQLHASEYAEAGRPVLNVRNVGLGEVRSEKLQYINEATAERLSGHILRHGDIVFGRKGAVERHAFIKGAFVGALQGSDCIRLRLKEGSPIRPAFATFALRTREHQEWMQSFCSHGATMASLNQDILRQVRLPDLDLTTQDHVVRILGSLDDLIENNRRRIELLEQMAQAIYREWFVNFRYPGHEDATLVDSPLGRIPKGWEVRAVDRLVELVKATVDPTLLDPDTPAVGLEHIPRRQLTLDDWGTAGCLGSRKTYFERGDLLFGKIRPYFHKVSVAPVSGICSTDAIVIRPNIDHWGLAVLTIFSDGFVANATQTSNGTKMPRADWKVIGNFPVAVPPLDLGRRFSAFSQDLLNGAKLLMLETRELAGIRNLLLPKLVTGQIDVSKLDLEALTESVA